MPLKTLCHDTPFSLVTQAGPVHRPRRLRRTPWLRTLNAETTLGVKDLIWPVFVQEGQNQRTPIPSMPEVFRMSPDVLCEELHSAIPLGIPAIALFPVVSPEKKSPDGEEALNPDNLVCRTLKILKATFPDLGLITDVALDPYTTHGHDGLLKNGEILNDETVQRLCQQALLQAQAGADIVAPSDMMDGRVGAIRRTLDQAGYTSTAILSYAVKYASVFYGPFREAVQTGALLQGDKKTYQMNPANTDEALREAALDLQEGADMIMIKPGLPYLDIIARVKNAFHAPTFAYQVSGEYAMLRFAAQAGCLDYEKALMESLLCFKRAGADAILSYGALDAARLLGKK